jgi:hypothetical protein
MTLGMSFAVFLILAILFLLAGLWLRYRNWRDVQGAFFNVVIILAVLLAIDLLYVITFEWPNQRSGFWSLSGVVLLFGLLGFLHLLTVLRSVYLLQSRTPNLVNQLLAWIVNWWSWERSLGGDIWADLASTVSVLGGIGGYLILAQQPGWWWLGQLGALLTLTVSFALFQRWMMESPTAPPETSLVNSAIGILTVLALQTPVASNVPLLQRWPGLAWFWLLFLLTVPLVIVVVLLLTRFNQFQTAQIDRGKLLAGLLLAIGAGLAVLLLFVFGFGGAASLGLRTSCAVLATFAWLVACLFRLGRLVTAWYTHWSINLTLYLTLEKNLAQLFSALLLLVYLFSQSTQAAKNSLGWTLLISIGASLAGFTLLRALLMTIISQRGSQSARSTKPAPRLNPAAALRRHLARGI